MDRLRAIADAHYRAGPPRVKALAHEFFKELDSDQDGRVTLHEFLVFMTDQGYTRLSNPNFFRDLDRDGNGSLDFWEVLTLYYIVKSGRPLCDCCGILIPGTFFSCVECFDSPSTGAYALCIYCYRSNRSNHNHNGHQQFLDTFTLLETKKRSALGSRGRQYARVNEATHQMIVPAQPAHIHNHMPQWQPAPTPDHMPNNAIVPAAQVNKWRAALAAFEIALGIGSISTTLCSILLHPMAIIKITVHRDCYSRYICTTHLRARNDFDLRPLIKKTLTTS